MIIYKAIINRKFSHSLKLLSSTDAYLNVVHGFSFSIELVMIHCNGNVNKMKILR